MTTLEEIRKPVEAELEAYQRLFDQALGHNDPFMHQALGYIRRRKGKMMRPILVMLSAKEAGTAGQATLMSALTLELLHTASLVHDDVVDESGERRGQRSVNAVYDNKVAVLLGDYLLASSLHAASETGHLRIVDIIAQLGRKLAEGEIFQLTNTQSNLLSEDNYFHIISHKTAALFRACTQLGYLSATAETDESTLENHTRLGEIIGLMFQIRDDIFDYYDDADIGKPRANDMAEGKLTLPALYALNTAGDEAMKALALRVRQHRASPDEIGRLIAFTKDCGGIAYAEEKMQSLRSEALGIIGTFRHAEVRTALRQYVDFVIERNT